MQVSIEGYEILIIGKNIRPSGGRPRPSCKDIIVYPLEVKGGGKAEITIEYEPHPKLEDRFSTDSLLLKGSKIEGKTLWGFSPNLIRRDDIVIGGLARSSTHSNQELYIRGGCFMAVIDGWVGRPVIRHPKEIYLLS
jgi:hypothetical protein